MILARSEEVGWAGAVPRPRAMWGLAVSKRRLSLNQLNGRVMLPWQWRIATMLTLAGRVVVLGAAVALGFVLRWLGIGSDLSSTALTTLYWAITAIAVFVTASTTSPDAGLALREAGNRRVLTTLSPLTSGQYVVNAAVVPRVLELATLVTAAAAVALPWRGFDATTGLLLAGVAGGGLLGSAVALAALAGLALVPAMAARARSLTLAAVTGAVVGAAVAVLVLPLTDRWRGSSVAELGATLQQATLKTVLATQPPGWTVVVAHGGGAMLGTLSVLTVLVIPLDLVLLRRVADKYALAPVNAAQRRSATSAEADSRRWLSAPSDVAEPTLYRIVRLVVGKDLVGVRRLPALAALPVRRVRLLGALLTGAALGFAAGGGSAHLHGLSWMAFGFTVFVLGIVSGVQDQAVQVSGIEAERRSWDLLRGTPVPSGTFVVAKAASVAVQLAAMVGVPLATWSVVISRSAGEAIASVVFVALLLVGSGAGAVIGAVLAHRTEGSAQATVERDPLATIVHAVVLIGLAAPVLIAEQVRPGNSGIPMFGGALTLAAVVAVGYRVARSDMVSRRWR